MKLDVCIGDVLGDKADVIVNGVSSNYELQGQLTLVNTQNPYVCYSCLLISFANSLEPDQEHHACSGSILYFERS